MRIVAKNIEKNFGEGENSFHAIKNANITIEQGDFISISGPSGGGKSTFLHILSTLDFPTSGTLHYDEQEVLSLSDNDISAIRRQRIGFVFQQFNLMPILTVYENIIMPSLLDKRQPDPKYIDEIVTLLEIGDRLKHLPNELSGGQQQRVAIARALIAKPDVIFADEPTGNLDSQTGKEVIHLLKNINQKMGRTLVMVTHDTSIAQMAARQFRIVDGVLSEVVV
jgi:putative ABC transport system ATP-binding protein